LIAACCNTTIPDNVTNIGMGAFCGCSSLTSITIPNSVTRIGDKAFHGCSSLTSITIPNSVVSIGESTFGDCSGLTSVSIPNGVTSMGRHAFSGCESLTSITIPQGVNCIEEWAFANCWELTSISISNSVTSIGDYAFYGCKSIESLAFPYGVTSIGDYAFQGCSGLTSVTFPYGVTNIGYDAFRGCTSLTSVTIPSSVTNIGMGAFCGCTGLTSATILNPDLQSQYDYVFIGCDNLPSGEYVWIVGTWACDMGPYGTVVVKFDGDGSSGTCTEAQYGSYKTGTYNVSGNTLRYKLFGESGTTTIEIEPGHKLSAGGGYYYHKRDNDDTQYYENDADNVADGLTNEYDWILGEWKGVDFKGDLAIITRDGIVCNNAVRSGMLDEVEPDRSQLTKQAYEIKKTEYDFDNKEYMSIVVKGDSAYFRDGEAAYFLDLKSKVIFYFYDFDQKITLKKVK
jgi:hypothetical protein